MSSINPNNINGQYPIAGQDNDSQGFRDNFTNIKNNLTFAKSEIEAIEQRAILKTALPGITLNNEMNNGQIKGAQLLRATETIKDLAEVGTTIDWTEGHFQYFTLSENTTLSLTGWPTSGFYTKLRLQVNVTNTAYTLTLPTAVSLANANSIQGCTARVITFPATGTYLFEFSTYDNGTTITVQDLLRNYDNTSVGEVLTATTLTVSTLANITANTASTSTTTGALKVAGGVGIVGNVNIGEDLAVTGVSDLQSTVLLSSSEDLGNTAAVSLLTTASYFTTAGEETASLAAGEDGQLKTLMAANVASGDMVITVTNAGWGGAETITFDGNGQGCTLQYINSKWFCVGNNGATFA
jgi:hypothetical protein